MPSRSKISLTRRTVCAAGLAWMAWGAGPSKGAAREPGVDRIAFLDVETAGARAAFGRFQQECRHLRHDRMRPMAFEYWPVEPNDDGAEQRIDKTVAAMIESR